MNPISFDSAPLLTPSVSRPAAPATSSGEFQSLLSSSIAHLESDNSMATKSAQQFLSGETDDLHKVALASQRAALSSELFMQVRNKVISAYQEVMKMQM